MARRRTTRRRRRRKQKISILALTEAGLMTSVIFKGMFNNTVMGFLLPEQFMPTGLAWESQTSAGLTGPYAGGNTLSLNEFFGRGQGQHTSIPVIEQLRENLKANGWMMAINMVIIPASFRLGKTLARPAILQANRLLDNVGLKAVKI